MQKRHLLVFDCKFDSSHIEADFLKKINCGHPGILFNGWLENIDAGTGLGATPCVVPSVSQGTIVPIEIENETSNHTTIGYSLSSKVRHGISLEVLCNENYEFPRSSQLPPTCYNGTWSVIPKCVPAKCKTMPKAPKFGIVLAAKTEHGMRAVFKCKDGFVLKSPNGSVINNKQIMYDCDKGYVLEEGPPGATCIGGKWSPSELPKCLLGQHPRIRWNRKRRSLKLNFLKKLFKRKYVFSTINQNHYLRAKRATHDAEELENKSNKSIEDKKQKNKAQCLEPKNFKYEVLKHSKDSNATFGPGAILKIICESFGNLSIEQFNNTEPKNFKYEVLKHSKDSNATFGPGAILKIICESFGNLSIEQFNNTGPSSLKCYNGKLIPTTFPECLPSPCILPTIQQATYQGGYRAGLTIAHSSSVIIQCESSSGTRSSIQLEYIKCEEIVNESVKNVISDSLGNMSSALLNVQDKLTICKAPKKFDEYLNYKHESGTVNNGFPEGTEILFSCIPSITGEIKSWKIVCERGIWIGRAFPCDTDEDGFSNVPLINGSCIFRNNEPHIISFYNDLEIREEYVEFPPDSIIITRCVDIGKYAMIGSSERKCIKSKWTGSKPHCIGLNQENDYAMEKAPTILFRHQNGPIAQKGWTTEEGRDPQLEYRLSILHAVKEDSGVYTCSTPARHTHAIEVIVQCKHPGAPPNGYAQGSPPYRAGDVVQFNCNPEFMMQGQPIIACQDNGRWSGGLPKCIQACSYPGTAISGRMSLYLFHVMLLLNYAEQK
uniref:CSON007528 protein n=1 Tax=Culicoides sonorensis TaxID=179676 RepID=A0A336LXT8_CULSO